MTVFLGGSPTTSTWLLAIAAVACFVANEPLLVLVGQRGTRTQREESGRAKRALLISVLFALAAGIGGLALAPRAAQFAVVLPLLLGGTLVMLAIQGLERSVFGEVLAAATLSSVAVPLGLTAGLDLTSALAVALIWAVTALLGTAVVRLTVARTKAKTPHELQTVRVKRAALIAVCLGVIGVGVAAPFGSRIGLWVLAAAVPVALVVLIMAALRPTARRLRLMGWSLVFANLLSLIAVVTTLKIIPGFRCGGTDPTVPHVLEEKPVLAKDIMTENPVTATELMSVAEALGLLYELDVRHLPVVRGSELVGIVSDRDLRGFTTPSEDDAIDAMESARGSTVGNFMNTDPIRVDTETNIREVVELMLVHRVGAIPVCDLDTGDLLGIVSYVDSAARASRDAGTSVKPSPC